MVDFVITPTACSKTYTCTNAGAHGDLCAMSTGTTVGSFDNSSLIWSFSSTDTSSVPEGTYIIKITCTAGTASDVIVDHDFTFTLTNPCPTATLAFSGMPFSLTYTYMLYNPLV